MPASRNSPIQLKEGGRVHLRPLKYKKVHGVGNFHNGHPLLLCVLLYSHQLVNEPHHSMTQVDSRAQLAMNVASSLHNYVD